VLDEIRRVPGVVDAGATSVAIDGGPVDVSPLTVNGERMDGEVWFRTVTPG
jgi:hypothetical protein